MSAADKAFLFGAGLRLLTLWCERNSIAAPQVDSLQPGDDRRYYLGTCAFYRPTTICIMVPKCAHRGTGGRAWSWPGYVIDRTPYGVLQHELGHHVDHVRSEAAKSRGDVASLFSWKIYQKSKEAALTGYLGTDDDEPTFYMEWFAENFRLFVTNPALCKALRPLFFQAVCDAGLKPLPDLLARGWEGTLVQWGAPARIVEMARKKLPAALPLFS